MKSSVYEDEELIERLAELEHKQWMEWSKSVLDEIMGDPMKTKAEMRDDIHELHQRWLEYWKPYSELPEEAKEKDREWARKVIQKLESRTSSESGKKACSTCLYDGHSVCFYCSRSEDTRTDLYESDLYESKEDR